MSTEDKLKNVSPTFGNTLLAAVNFLKMKQYILVNIGCIECGVSSNIVGVFDDKEKADTVAAICYEKYDWREGGQNSFKVFEMPELNVVNPEYSEAQNIVDKYKSEQLNKHAVISCVVVREDCPDGYWYSNQKGKEFNVKACHYSDLQEVEGFSNKEPNECWKVADGEFAGNVMAKQHCLRYCLPNGRQ